MILRVVIFGGHIQALGLARQVKSKGIEVVIVTDDGCSIARFSRAVDNTPIESVDLNRYLGTWYEIGDW